MMIVNYFKKYPYALVMIIVLIVWGIINSVQVEKYTEMLAKDGIFTVAEIKEIKGSRGRTVVVEFDYEGRTYKAEKRNETIPHSWIGEKIFVKFLPSRPIVAEYYERIEVSDSLKALSSPLWEELPIDIPEK